MKYTLEERMDIGRRLYTHELTCKEAMEQYDIGRSTAQKFMTDYKRANSIPIKNHQNPTTVVTKTSSPDIETYMAMSKEELFNELILAKANELRAKKGYEVKGVGANKEFISLSNRNTKS